MVEEKTADDEVVLQAVVQAVDQDALLDGEDPATVHLDDAEHWIAVYRELIQYKESLLQSSAEHIEDLEHTASVIEASDVDAVILEAELHRFRRRLAFWQKRLTELSRTRSS